MLPATWASTWQSEMVHKIYIAIFLITAAGGITLYLINLGKAQAEKEHLSATLSAVTTQFGEYATKVEGEVDAYRRASQVLSNKYIKAEREASDAKKQLYNMDLSDIDSINAAIERVLTDTERASCRISTSGAGSSATSAACADDPGAVSREAHE